jgi:sterol desaturase/sphingolipid hydroxylase (fatty acid hydroxylase superfamily)
MFTDISNHIEMGGQKTFNLKNGLPYLVLALTVFTIALMHYYPSPALFDPEQKKLLNFLHDTKLLSDSSTGHFKNILNQFLPDINGTLYFIYLILCFVIVVVVYVIERSSGSSSSALTSTGKSRPSAQSLKSFLFPNGFLNNKNIQVDILLFTIMPVWRVLIFTAPIMTTISTGLYIQRILNSHFTSPQLQANLFISVIYSLFVILMVDLSFYAIHYVLHFTELGWKIHETHHSQTEPNFFTTGREHPITLILFNVFPFGLFGGLLGLFLFLFPTAEQIVIADVALGFLLFLPTRIFRHSHILIRYPAWIESFFQSPAFHIVHHSYLPQHRNKNLGDFTTVWDRVFGTLHTPVPGEDYEFGTGDALVDSKHRTLHGIYIWQTSRMLSQAVATPANIFRWARDRMS